MFRIGEFARFTRVSVKMLRHYDQLGLLPAAWIDPATGYRYYDTAQLPRLNRILLLRELGFRLDEIGRLLEEDVDEVYADRERELRETVRRTQAQLRAVAARRELLRAGAVPLADVVVRPVPALAVATLSGPAHLVGPLFFALEEYVAGHRARAARPPLSLLDGTGSVTVAVPVTSAVPAGSGVSVRELPAVPEMACVVHRGGYGGLDGCCQQLLRWLAATGRRPAGPLREVYLRFDAEPELALPPAFLTADRDDLVTELQVPVRA